MKKKIITLLSILALSSNITSAAPSTVKVMINDKPLVTDTQAIIRNNRTMVPFRAVFESLGAKNIGIYVGVYFMEEHSIDTDKFTSVWIPSYGSDSGFYEATPKTDIDYDIHQYTSKGKIAGFDHDLDINVISSLKNKEETFRKLFLKP